MLFISHLVQKFESGLKHFFFKFVHLHNCDKMMKTDLKTAKGPKTIQTNTSPML